MKHEGLHGSGEPFRLPTLAEVKERANNYIKEMEAGGVIKNSVRVVEAVALTAAASGVTFDVGKSLAEHGDVSHARTVQLVNDLSATIKAYVSRREIRIPAIGGSEMVLTPTPPFGTQTETATATATNTPQATATPTETPTPDIASTEAGATAIKLFEQIKVDPSTYDLKMDGNVVVGIDKATGKEIFRDGKFELHYAVQAAVNSGDLVPTKYKPIPKSQIGIVNRPTDQMSAEYLIPLITRTRAEFKKTTGSDPFTLKKSAFNGLMLDPEELAWGVVLEVDRNDSSAPDYLVYETKGGGITIVPVRPGSMMEAIYFWVE